LGKWIGLTWYGIASGRWLGRWWRDRSTNFRTLAYRKLIGLAGYIAPLDLAILIDDLHPGLYAHQNRWLEVFVVIME